MCDIINEKSNCDFKNGIDYILSLNSHYPSYPNPRQCEKLRWSKLLTLIRPTRMASDDMNRSIPDDNSNEAIHCHYHIRYYN